MGVFTAGLGDHRINTALCPGDKERMRRLMNIVEAGRLDLGVMVTHHYKLDDIVEAYDLFSNQRDGVLKVAIKPFESLLLARRWVTELVHWYNGEHRHSAIGFVTPDERHAQLDQALLHTRTQVYEKARQANPLRWSKRIRNWQYVEAVHLNPDQPHSQESQITQKSA